MIEKTLERIATALEAIANHMEPMAIPIVEAVIESIEPPAAPIEPPAVEAPPHVAPVPPSAPLSMEEFNAALVVEFKRLGSDRGPIDAAFKIAGVAGVSDMSPSDYNSFLENIQALPGA